MANNKKITIGTFDCTNDDIIAVLDTLKSGYLSSGKELNEFEDLVARWHKYRYGVMTNSGQSALEVALILAKVKLGKNSLKVVVPTTTYAATLWAVLNTNNTPIFCDVDELGNIDYSNFGDKNAQIEEVAKADVVLAVDLCGKVNPVPDWIREKYFIIDDACESFGNKHSSYANITCFSFYVSHIITTGSGGMLCLNDKELADYARSYIAHGRTYGGNFTENNEKWIDKFSFNKVGVSYRSDNLSASLGLSQFKRIDKILEKRKENAMRLVYPADVRLKSYYLYPTYDYHCMSVFQFFPFVIKDSAFDRKGLLEFLYDYGVETRVLLSLTNQPIFRKLYGDKKMYEFPNSHYLNDFGFIVGCHQNLGQSAMEFIEKLLIRYAKEKQ